MKNALKTSLPLLAVMSLTTNSYAQQTFAGSWPNSGTPALTGTHDDYGTPLVRTDYSNGPLTVAATASLTVNGNYGTNGTNEWGVLNYSLLGYNSGYNWQRGQTWMVDEDSSMASEFSVSFDTPLDFGSVDTQNTWSGTYTENSIYYSFGAGHNYQTLGSSNVRIELVGGATIAELGGIIRHYDLVGGGVGFNFVEYSFNENPSTFFGAQIVLNNFKILGSLEEIKITEDNFRPGDASAGYVAATSTLMFTQPIPEPSGVILLGLAGALGFIRRNRAA